MLVVLGLFVEDRDGVSEAEGADVVMGVHDLNYKEECRFK